MPGPNSQTNQAIKSGQNSNMNLINLGTAQSDTGASNFGTTIGDYQNQVKTNIAANTDQNAVAANRGNFQTSADVTQNMIGQIAARPGGYTPGEVASMKLAATSPISASNKTAQGQMMESAARTGNAASLNPAIASSNRAAGQAISGAEAGVESQAAEARRADTQQNTQMALSAQTQMPGQYQTQQQLENNITTGNTAQLQFAPTQFANQQQMGNQLNMAGTAGQVPYAQILQQLQTSPALWQQILGGISGMGAKVGNMSVMG